MKQKSNDKIKIFMGIATVGLVSLILAIYLMGLANIDWMIILTMFLVIGTTAIMLKNIKSIKKGLPISDELAKKVSWKAAAYAYFFTVWLAVFSLWYDTLISDLLGLPGLTVIELVALIVLVPGIFYIIMYFYFNRKGDI